MHRKRILLLAIVIICVTACNNRDKSADAVPVISEKKLDGYKENDTLSLEDVPDGLKQWLTYYQRSDQQFTLGNFRYSGVSLHFDQLPDATAKEDSAVFARYIRFSPDRNRYIDLFSYDHFLDNGVLVGGDADQEVILGDKANGTRKQLMFNTPGRQAEWADWLNTNSFLIGLTSTSEDGKRWGAQILLFRIKDSSYSNFDLTHTMAIDSMSFSPKTFSEVYTEKLQQK
ncbi:MAG: hypothetical protein EAZ17_07455 [Sphingobacteriales bacterium]|nr:MAG: hypothetical protein EAZ17_07455 [Sphingobacteriales bacterium]